MHAISVGCSASILLLGDSYAGCRMPNKSEAKPFSVVRRIYFLPGRTIYDGRSQLPSGRAINFESAEVSAELCVPAAQTVGRSLCRQVARRRCECARRRPSLAAEGAARTHRSASLGTPHVDAPVYAAALLGADARLPLPALHLAEGSAHLAPPCASIYQASPKAA
eukprot:6177245-Pleurochrysis_carterae.AAC.8